MAKAKTEKATITRVGYTNDRNTVLYVTGQGEAQGRPFRMTVTSGDYQIFDNEFTRSLVGKDVVYAYTSLDDMRTPQGVKFVEVL